MKNAEAKSYALMSTRQRAEFLLTKGVAARLDINPATLTPAYVAHVPGIGRLPGSYHADGESAIAEAEAWLRAKAKEGVSA